MCGAWGRFQPQYHQRKMLQSIASALDTSDDMSHQTITVMPPPNRATDWQPLLINLDITDILSYSDKVSQSCATVVQYN